MDEQAIVVETQEQAEQIGRQVLADSLHHNLTLLEGMKAGNL